MSVFKTIDTKDSRRERREAEAQAAQVASVGPSRQERRKAAHRGLAECEAASGEYEALRAELARIQGQMDEAANEHVQACEPIQRELKQLGDDTVTRIIAGQCGTDERSDKRRNELLQEVSAANAKLEDTLRNLKAQAVPIEIRAVAAGARSAKSPQYRSELLDTADPQLRAVSNVAQRTHMFAQSRLHSAIEKAKQYPNEPTWQLELTTAAMLHEQATREADEALQALLTTD